MDSKRLNGLIGNIAAAVRKEVKKYEAPPDVERSWRTPSDETPWALEAAKRRRPPEPVPEEARRNWEVCWGGKL